MKWFAAVLSIMVLLALSCAKKETMTTSTAGDATATPSVEKTYPLVGTIVSRDAPGKQLIIKHEDIGDWMKAMTMPFEVRDQDFASLPPDGTPITATVHATDTSWWITDVQASVPVEGTATDSTATGTTQP
jgi:Cu/Ag efflux protein CusF